MLNKPDFRNDYIHISMQKKVREDIYMVLLNLGLYPQTPDCIAITTKDGMHIVNSYFYDDKYDHWGSFEHSISVVINDNYEFEELEKIIKYKVGKKERTLNPDIAEFFYGLNERLK